MLASKYVYAQQSCVTLLSEIISIRRWYQLNDGKRYYTGEKNIYVYICV